MSDGFIFTGLSNDQPIITEVEDVESDNTNKQSINVEKELLNKPTILIDVAAAKKGSETIVTGLTEEYVTLQNPDTNLQKLVVTFKKKKGCIGTLKKNKVDGVEIDEIVLVFRGKHREDLSKFLMSELKLDPDQIKVKGLES